MKWLSFLLCRHAAPVSVLRRAGHPTVMPQGGVRVSRKVRNPGVFYGKGERGYRLACKIYTKIMLIFSQNCEIRHNRFAITVLVATLKRAGAGLANG